MSLPTTHETGTPETPETPQNPPSTPQDEADVRWLVNVRTAANHGLEEHGPIADQRDAIARLLEVAAKIARTYQHDPDTSLDATIHRRWRNLAGLALMCADTYVVHGPMDGSNP